jgi:hypothetical protein
MSVKAPRLSEKKTKNEALFKGLLSNPSASISSFKKMEPEIFTKSSKIKETMSSQTIQLKLGFLGVKFECIVKKEWTCERLFSIGISKYHESYPHCQVPEFNMVYHSTRKEYLTLSESIEKYCKSGDELEFAKSDKMVGQSILSQKLSLPQPIIANNQDNIGASENEFTVMFHRLPLGFTLKQENEETIVANIYPHSTATHYERLTPGVSVTHIGDATLQGLGLRQVHDLIKNAKLPLEIRFRLVEMFSPPLRRTSRISSTGSGSNLSDKMSLASQLCTRSPMRNKPDQSPSRIINTSTISSLARSVRAKSSTSDSGRALLTDTFSTAVPIIFNEDGSVKSHFSKSKHQLIKEQTQKSSQIPTIKRTSSISSISSINSLNSSKSSKIVTTGHNHLPVTTPSCISTSNTKKSLKALIKEHIQEPENPEENLDISIGENQSEMSSVRRSENTLIRSPNVVPPTNNTVIVKKSSKPVEEMVSKSSKNPLPSAVDSNQVAEEETEEAVLIQQIKKLQADYLKKQEELKQIALQLQQHQVRFSKIRIKQGKKALERSKKETSSSPTKEQTINKSKSISQKKVMRLTPEVLEQMDLHSGLPPKSSSRYAGSNASSISGYSSYSNQSSVAASGVLRSSRIPGSIRSSARTTTTRRTGGSTTRSVCSDARSVCSVNSVSSDRRSAKHSDRYSYIPQRYSNTSNVVYDPPSSFSTKGAVIARAKVSRDSYIGKSDSPGVGAYDIKKLEKVKGGEIGDSNRALPWP